MRQFFILAIFSASVGFRPVAFAGAARETSFKNRAVSTRNARTFTLNQAIQTALRQNPTVLNAIQEIQRTKGVIIQIRAEALPHVTPSGGFEGVDPNLRSSSSFASSSATPGTIGGASGGISGAAPAAAPTASPITGSGRGRASDLIYSIRVTGTQLIFNGTTWPAIRGSFFQRDSAYFSLRNIVDQVLPPVKTQFYQIVVDKALI